MEFKTHYLELHPVVNRDTVTDEHLLAKFRSLSPGWENTLRMKMPSSRWSKLSKNEPKTYEVTCLQLKIDSIEFDEIYEARLKWLEDPSSDDKNPVYVPPVHHERQHRPHFNPQGGAAVPFEHFHPAWY